MTDAKASTSTRLQYRGFPPVPVELIGPLALVNNEELNSFNQLLQEDQVRLAIAAAVQQREAANHEAGGAKPAQKKRKKRKATQGGTPGGKLARTLSEPASGPPRRPLQAPRSETGSGRSQQQVVTGAIGEPLLISHRPATRYTNINIDQAIERAQLNAQRSQQRIEENERLHREGFRQAALAAEARRHQVQQPDSTEEERLPLTLREWR